jgi:3',5'-cyclic AMP phosphodiesterase CpdA
MKFILISDTHLVAPGNLLYGLDPAERLRSCVADIVDQHPDAAFVVIAGDLAHRGEPMAYESLRALLAPLKMPVHLLIGNHDDRACFQAAFPEAASDEYGFVQFSIETPAGRFIGLDTNEPGAHYGRLCSRRLGWLADRLHEADARPVYLFMHHAPFAVGLRKMDSISLRDNELLSEVLLEHGNVRHIFFGHLHRSLSGSWHGIPFSNLPGTSHQVALDFVVEDEVPGSHEPPAYAVVFAYADSTLVHLRNFTDRTATFNL